MNIGGEIGFAVLVWGLGGVTGWIIGSPPPSTPHRAEAMVVYDSGTGCQYLSSHSGGLIPRLDAKGRQVCRYE